MSDLDTLRQAIRERHYADEAHVVRESMGEASGILTVGLVAATGPRLMVRLVKGAYWDTEIKYARKQGLPDYPALTERPGPIATLIAETGGQNVMLVDSTALPEQVVDDVTAQGGNVELFDLQEH